MLTIISLKLHMCTDLCVCNGRLVEAIWHWVKYWLVFRLCC